MRGNTWTVVQRVELITESCCICGVLFAMTDEVKSSRLQDHRSFYCPNGHAQNYVDKTDREKLREAEAALRQAEAKLSAEVDQRKAADRELARQRKRAKGGACPCCNRTFVQLARHIKTQHPGFTP
jgi:hypothetical protein